MRYVGRGTHVRLFTIDLAAREEIELNFIYSTLCTYVLYDTVHDCVYVFVEWLMQFSNVQNVPFHKCWSLLEVLVKEINVWKV